MNLDFSTRYSKAVSENAKLLHLVDLTSKEVKRLKSEVNRILDIIVMIDHRVVEELASEDEISDSEPQMLKCLQPNELFKKQKVQVYHHPTSSEVKKKSTPKRHKLVARIFGGQKFEFPLVLGKPSCRVSVQEIGDLFPEHSYDIPVGFQSKRKFISLRDANQKTFYQCSTFLEQNSLMYQIVQQDMPSNLWKGVDPDMLWMQFSGLFHGVMEFHSLKDFFGIDHETVAKILDIKRSSL